jgi:hypothetical protein
VKASLIDMLIEARRPQIDAQRLELEGLGVRELLARARALGLDAEVEAAQDSDDPKGEVVELLLCQAR